MEHHSQFHPENSNSVFISNNVQIDCENWMGQLPDHLTHVPLIYISIPGSHNSFSYSISPNSDVSPDSPPFLRNMGKWGKPLIKRFIYKWSLGQKEDVFTQLLVGIRYFDIRLVMKDDRIFISHGLYGAPVQEFLKEINFFLESHQKEVVILDFQHFYDFHPQHHERMTSMVSQIFGNKICKRRRKMIENTLNILWQYNHQVLIIYRHQVAGYNELFWPSSTWASPWPNKIKVRELIEYLNTGLSIRKDGMGHVSQGILTPDAKYVVSHMCGSSKSLASHANKKVIAWLESKNNGVNGINVVIVDFVERNNFCEKVILLNYKRIHDYQIHFNVTDNLKL